MVSPANEGVLLSRLEAARQLYNACLGEAMRRVKLIRQSRDFTWARSLKPSNPERKVLFKRVRERYDFSEYALHSYSTQRRKSWLGNHLDSNTVQKLATRAYKAVEKVLFGKSKKVRFKGKNQMDSVEGKSNKSGIRWKGEAVEWSGLELRGLITDNDPVILHGLNSKVKYVRLVRRKISGKNRFYAQLVCEGKPFVKPKNKLAKGEVGLDIGPSTIAIVGDTAAQLKEFASELEFDTARIRLLQRRMDRSRRATNPDNYNPNGTLKKGKKRWNSSKSYLKVRTSKANLERKLAAHRKSLHGELVNDILRTGDVIKLEKLSYKHFKSYSAARLANVRLECSYLISKVRLKEPTARWSRFRRTAQSCRRPANVVGFKRRNFPNESINANAEYKCKEIYIPHYWLSILNLTRSSSR